MATRGSTTRAATEIQDTIGDLLKYTAVPALYSQVKLRNIKSVTLLPLFVRFGLNLFQLTTK